MSDNSCETLTQCFLWITSIGEKHHCTVIQPPKKKRYIEPKKFYGKFK